ncbi:MULTISPECIES: ExeM/NucH family extracellular endonuclease [Vibrio]|uniref:ExeM/NucH family extracellular endonuclease n=1 Tax=Vibrio TaxID=662 RepID=UPI00029A52BA|nr:MULTISPECIES: ExeM/NucH family extracellular endonuclease [Vibrio]KNH14928.1 nuclease [Vibrio lentus]KAA8598348.1 Extracellular deoxyribonuclease Xds [Vibrio cyclitrophicus]MBU2931094.1 ExeM/NucH family extracellular endonuclease [Vibrio cyclitrophicus]MDH5879602.1 ExeM/NucH family extracellular endonuclease [Vibrio sp. S/42/10]OBT18258.1 nuclease [Vibrio cyclitrophicus]|tara:strand:- start:85 stop:3069 length:2985 start_codon:yes stop_codon:yes gene_type:complete
MDTLIKPSLLALTIASTLSANANAEIIISQYVEGGSYNKAVEIANIGDTAVTLTGYELAKSSNGDGSWGSKLDLSTVTLQANQVYVVAHGDSSAAITAIADFTDKSVANFNGDDPLALLKNGEVHDILGVMGDVDFGKDTTLVRNSDALTPSATYQAAQWTAFAKDNIDGLGDLNTVEPPVPFVCEVDGQQPTFTTIQDIQGEEGSSPLIDGYPYITEEDHFVTGVVSAVTTGLTKGFYLQAIENDNNDKTSEGLFIHTDTADTDLKPGDVVCVKGKVQEYYSSTQLSSDANSYIKTGESDISLVTELNIKEGETLRDALERHEGMQVELSSASDLFVTRNFSYDYDSKRNNMMLSYQAPLLKPTQLYAAESEGATDLAKENASNRVFLESDDKAANGQIPYYPEFGQDADQDGTSEQHIRLGSRVEGLHGVVSYSYNEYRLIATNEVNNTNFVTSGDNFDVARKATPSIAESDLRVASFNVLNYFTSVADSGHDNPTGQNRGATNLDEFLIQQAKIVAAMSKMDADIIGLMEIENNGFGDDSALNNLVNALNAEIDDVDDHYTYVEVSEQDKYQDEYFGSDAIMVAILYRAKAVMPKQAAKVIVTPEQHIEANTITRNEGAENNPSYDKYQRHSLLQTFTVQETGEDLSIVVNHFKSKGSECIEEWLAGVEDSEPTDLQGNCNNFRVSAAHVVGEALKDIQGDMLVMGDLNAYGMEDPLLTLTDYSKDKYERDIYTASYTTLDGGELQVEKTQIQQGYGYHNLNTVLHGSDTFSYTYSGELGNLDHALASSSLAQKVVAIEDWHINSLESNLFEYSSKYTGNMPKYKDAFSASDHDPVIIAIDFPNTDLDLPSPGEKFAVEVRLPPNAAVNDIVTVSLTLTGAIQAASSDSEAQGYTASVTLDQADIDARSVNVEFNEELDQGQYLLEEKLTDSTGETVKFSSEREVTVEKSDTTPTVPTEPEGTVGGSFGFGALMSLFGLAMWRRRKPLSHN